MFWLSALLKRVSRAFAVRPVAVESGVELTASDSEHLSFQVDSHDLLARDSGLQKALVHLFIEASKRGAEAVGKHTGELLSAEEFCASLSRVVTAQFAETVSVELKRLELNSWRDVAKAVFSLERAGLALVIRETDVEAFEEFADPDGLFGRRTEK